MSMAAEPAGEGGRSTRALLPGSDRAPRAAAASPTLADFAGAPRGSYVSPEGWLVVGEEAWTLHEWRVQRGWYRPVRRRAEPAG